MTEVDCRIRLGRIGGGFRPEPATEATEDSRSYTSQFPESAEAYGIRRSRHPARPSRVATLADRTVGDSNFL